MNGSLSYWNYGLIFASLSVLLGVVGVVSTRRKEKRWLASGLFLQGVLLTFVVGGAYFHRTVDRYDQSTEVARPPEGVNSVFPGSVELRLGGLAVVGLLIVQSFLGPNLSDDDEPRDGGQSA